MSGSPQKFWRASHWMWERRIDLVGLLLAAIVGLPSLAYHYGRDQAFFHYVGREWLAGRLPYRDVFDIKPPGPYAIYAVGSALFDDAVWPIRFAELVVVVALGVLVGLIARHDRNERRGTIGMAALVVASVYYTQFDYWHTAQVEIWQTLFVFIGAYFALARRPGFTSGAAVGAAAAAALLFKITAVFSVAVLAAIVVMRAIVQPARGRCVAMSGAGLLAGLALVLLVAIGLLAAAGAGSGMWDVVEYVEAYRLARPRSLGAGMAEFFLVRAVAPVALLAGAFVLAAARPARTGARRHWGRVLVLVSLMAGATASVLVQQKFILYHWGCVVGPLALLGVWALAPGGGLLRNPREALGAGLAIAVVALAAAPPWQSEPSTSYPEFAVAAWRAGLRSSRLAHRFEGETNYNVAAQMELASLIRARGIRPGDRLHVRGYEHALYVLTGLSSPARFVNETHFAEVENAMTAEWLSAQERALDEERPRFFVTFTDREEDLQLLRGRGYTPLGESGLFVAMERPE